MRKGSPRRDVENVTFCILSLHAYFSPIPCIAFVFPPLPPFFFPPFPLFSVGSWARGDRTSNLCTSYLFRTFFVCVIRFAYSSYPRLRCFSPPAYSRSFCRYTLDKIPAGILLNKSRKILSPETCLPLRPIGLICANATVTDKLHIAPVHCIDVNRK